MRCSSGTSVMLCDYDIEIYLKVKIKISIWWEVRTSSPWSELLNWQYIGVNLHNWHVYRSEPPQLAYYIYLYIYIYRPVRRSNISIGRILL